MRPKNNFQPIIRDDSEFGKYGTPLFFQKKYERYIAVTTFRIPMTIRVINSSVKGDESNDESIVTVKR